MAKSLIMAMLISIIMFNIAHPVFSQEIEIDHDSEDQLPKDVNISPSDFDINVESPDEEPYEEADSPAMKYDMEVAHRYSEKQLDFLEDCVDKSSSNSKCEEEMFHNMVDDATQVTDECCRDILHIGKDCHLGLVKLTFSSYEHKNLASKAIPKSKQTWNECVRRVGSKIGAPVSLEQ